MGISGISAPSSYANVALQPGAANGATSSAVAPGSLGSLLTAAAGVYGSQNASEDQTQSINAGINTQSSTMGNINSLYGAQTTLGNSAMGALGSAEGLNGQPANYSGFENMPGYQFAQTMGVQAGERQAAAMGNAGNSGTAAMIGNQVTGTAMQDYNTYISQLMNSAGLGASANQQLAGANLETGTNISQLQQNSGQAAASGVSGASSAIGGAIGGLANSLTGGGGLGNTASGVGSLFNGSGVGTNTSGSLNGTTNYSANTMTDAQQAALIGNINAGTNQDVLDAGASGYDPNSDF
jgi:hypothetical protein